MSKECIIRGIVVVPEITNPEEKSQEFLDWTEEIEYRDNVIILPDLTEIDGKIFMNISLQFDNGSFTKTLENYYEGI